MQNSPVSEHLHRQVWLSMCDATRLNLYYEKMADRYQRKYDIVSGALIISAVVQTLSFQIDLFPYIQSLLGAVSTILISLVFFAGYGTKAAILKLILEECSEVELCFRTIWSEIHTFKIEDNEILERKENLDRRLLSTTHRSKQANLRVDQALNEFCTRTANKTMEDNYVKF